MEPEGKLRVGIRVFGGQDGLAEGSKRVQRRERRKSFRSVGLAAWLVVVVLLQTLAPVARGDQVPETEDPALAGATRPSCSIFIDASLKRNRFLLVQGFEDDAEVVVLDQFPAVVPGLGDLTPSKAYQQLRPGFMSIADHLNAQPKPVLVQPRHCHTHLLVASELQRHLGDERLDALLREILQASIEDAQFPFLFSRDDMRVIDSRAKGYYQMLGVNFLDGRIAQTLAPGSVELSGVLCLHDESLLVAFDQQERWRRGIRRKQLSRSLNTTDFYIFEQVDFVQDRLHLAIARQLFKQEQQRLQETDEAEKKPSKVSHPCLPRGVKQTLPVVGASASGVEFDGTGDAKACIANFAEFIKLTNKDCPQGSFCLLNSVSQPKPVSPFFASGKFMTISRFANEVLARLQQKSKDSDDEKQVVLLDLPLPSLAQVRSAAQQICTISATTLAEWNLNYEEGKSVNNACFDLCEVVSLLQQLGIEETEKRVVFGEPLAPTTRSTLGDQDLVNRNITTSNSASEVSWVVGVFLVLQLLEKRQTFSIESDYFAERVGEGVPVGLRMSLLLFVGALVFLYLTTGPRVKGRLVGYQLAPTSPSLNGSKRSSLPPRNTTSAIVFVDDASE